jgi:hypothetical protein
MTTTVDLVNKQDLDHPKSRVVRKSSSSSPTSEISTIQRAKLWGSHLLPRQLVLHKSCNSSPKGALIGSLFSPSLSLSVCTIAKALFVLTKRVGLHCGGWDVSSTCMKTTKFCSCCLELGLMFVLKLLPVEGILLPPNPLFLFVKVLLCIVYWIVEALLCFITMYRIKICCKHGVHHWFQNTQVCLCVLQRNLLEISHTSQSYKIPRTSMKPLSKSTLNFHGRC